MQGKVIKVNKSGKFLEVELPCGEVKFHTQDRKLLNHSRKKDLFYAHEAVVQEGNLVCLTPPLLQPDPKETEYYLAEGRIKGTGEDFDTLTKTASSLNKHDIVRYKALGWWRKEIVHRALRLINVDTQTARKVAKIKGRDDLHGIREEIILNPMVYPFITLDDCVRLFSFHGKKIPPFMMPILRLTRKVYDNLNNGWVYTPEWEVKKILPDYSSYLKPLEELNVVKEGKFFYYREALEAEKTLAKRVTEIAGKEKYEVGETEPREGISPEQLEALRLCLREPLAIVEGYAGTGKTTIIAELVRRLPEAVVVSFTGKAVSRLKKVTEGCCLTIHKLLFSEYIPSEIIIDEASMVSLPLFVSLVSRYPLRRLILIGDPCQLPPIEYGRVFEKLVASGLFPMARLSKVFRTQEDHILVNSLNLREGNLDRLEEGDNFRLLPGGVKEVLGLVEKLRPHEVTIISPYKNPLKELNRGCQEIYHKGKRSYPDLYGNRYYLGDRLMCRENDYEKEVFNGEEGIVTSINSKSMRVIFSSGIKEYNLQEEDDMEKVMHSYAISVHKSQGSEYNNVVFFLEDRIHGSFINKRMVYTALTRAKEKMFLVGNEADIYHGCHKDLPPSYDNIISRLRG